MKSFLISALCVIALSQVCVAADTEHSLSEIPNVVKHRAETMKHRPTVGIIVGSDSLRAESGEIATLIMINEGFKVEKLDVVKNLDVKEALEKMLANKDIEAILCIGGTGISPHDVTIEAVNEVVDKTIPGYGEYLRALTRERWAKHEDMLGLMGLDTRAIAGVAGNKIIFTLPGSPDGTRLAVEKIIIPGLPTLYGQLQKKEK